MSLRPESGRSNDSAAVAFLIGVLLFFSPLTFWWSAVASVWYLPYLLWLVWIGVIAWAIGRQRYDV